MPQKVKGRLLSCLSVILILSATAVLSTGPVREGDVFWHIRTGQWIWQNRSIPDHDPFTFTYQKEDPVRPGYLRQEIILRGYWLAQILYYLIYHHTGIAGVMAFRSLMITLILLIIYLLMRRLGTGHWMAFFFLTMSAIWFVNAGDRPHLFSFLLFPVVLYLMDSLKKGWAIKKGIGIILLMALWPNLHGGYVTGVAVIGIYLITSILRGQGYKGLYVISIISIIATLLNPNTYKTILGLIQGMFIGVQGQYVAEMLSPFKVFMQGYYYPEYWLTLFIALVVILLRPRVIPPERLIVVLFFMLTSLIHQRMIPFFMPSLILLAPEADALVRKKGVRVVMVMVGILLFISQAQSLRAHLFDPGISQIYPVGGSRFLNETSPRGNLFNWADWGGYLMIHSPEFRLFDDGRRLMDDVEIAHDAIARGLTYPLNGVPAWRAYLDAYDIDIIMIPPVHPIFGMFVGLVRAIYNDDDFALVYADNNCLIYLRRGRENDAIIREYELPKDLSVTVAIAGLLNFRSERDRQEKIRLIADLYRLIGREESARYYEKMLK